MFKSIKKYLVLLILIITAALTSVGYSAFVLSERVSNEATQSNLSNAITVNIKYQSKKTVENVELLTSVNEAGTSSTNYDLYYGILGKNTGSAVRTNNGSWLRPNYSYSLTEGETLKKEVDNGDGSFNRYEFTCLAKGEALLSNSWYGVKGTVSKVTYVVSDVVEVDSNNNQIIYKSYQINKNEKISKPQLNRNGYALVGFYKSNSAGTASTTELFDFDKPITANTTIFAKWNDLNQDDVIISSTKFADYINGVSGTGNVYKNSGGYDISNDPTYSNEALTISLTSATIKSGATINLCMNSGVTNIEAEDGDKITDKDASANTSDRYISLDYGGNTRDYTVVLQGDLVINGNLYVGGYTGSNSGDAEQGYIIKNYVTLDLNGYKITINNGGKLHSFGLIKDSKGTGLIDVKPGGYIYTQFVILDLNGGNNTLWAYGKDFCPFNNYSLPYLRCKVRLNATTSKAANLYAYSKLNLGELGFTNIYLPFIGDKTVETFLFNYYSKSGNTGYVELDYTPIDSLIELYPTSNENKNLLFNRNVLTFYNIEGNTGAAISSGFISVKGLVEKEFELSLDRVNFPLSSTLNMYFVSSNLLVSQSLVLQPGSVFEMDKDSNLIFDYYKNSSGTESKKKFSATSVVTVTLPGVEKYVSGSLIALNTNPTANNALSNLVGFYITNPNSSDNSKSLYYWNHFRSAICNIYGNVNFITGNNNEPYRIAGNVNISSYSVNGGTKKTWTKSNFDELSKVNIKTYKIEYNISNCYWFGGLSDLTGGNKSAHTNANYIYALPLVSNGIAYLYGDSYNVTGSYNYLNGIISGDDGNSYVLLTGDGLVTADYSTATSSSGTIQESPIDYSITPSECSIDGNYVVVGSQYYIYYGGNMFKANKTDATNCTATIIKFSTEVEGTNYSSYFRNRSFTFNTSTNKWVANAIA